MRTLTTILSFLAGFVLISGAGALPTTTYTSTSAPQTQDQPAATQEDTDIGLQIVEDYIYQPSLADGNQIGDSVTAAGRKYFLLVRDSLETAQYLDDRIQPYEVRNEFNYRKYWHSLHLLDQKTLDTLAGAWAVGEPLDIFWAYGFRVVRYSQASLFLDNKGQVLAVMVRVRHPGALQRYPIFLSKPYLTWYLEEKPPDDYIISDLIFLALVEASTVEPYNLREAVVADTGRYEPRYTRLVVEEPDYYPAVFYIEYVDTRYVCHPIFYDVYYPYHHPWWAYDHHAYWFYYRNYGVWPRYHPHYHGHYGRPRPIPWMVSGKEPLYDKHYRRLDRGDSISPGRNREGSVVDAYSRARPTLIGADKRTRGTEPVVRNIADIKTRSREGGVDSLVPGGRGVGAPSIGEGRGIGAPSIVDKRSTSPIDLGRANRSREADSGGTTVKWRPVSERMPAVDRVPERSREETPDIDARNLGRSREDAGEPARGGGINVIGAKRGAETPAVDVIDKRSGRGVQVDRVPARPGRSEAGLSPGERGQSRSVDVITPPPARGSDTPRSYEPRARETAPRVDIAPKIDSVPRNTAPPERRVSEPPAERSRDGGVSGDRGGERVITPQPDRNRVIDVVPKREAVPDSGNRGRSVAPPSGKRADSLDSSSRFSATGDAGYIPRSEPSFSTRPTLVERAPSTPAYISPRPTLMDRGPSIVPSDRGVGPTVRPAGRGR